MRFSFTGNLNDYYHEFYRIGNSFHDHNHKFATTSSSTSMGLGQYHCDAPFPGGPLTTRQPAKYSWMSGNPTPLMKIRQSLLCTGSSTQGTTCSNHMATCPNILQRPHWVHIRIKMSKMATWAHALIQTKITSTIYQ